MMKALALLWDVFVACVCLAAVYPLMFKAFEKVGPLQSALSQAVDENLSWHQALLPLWVPAMVYVVGVSIRAWARRRTLDARFAAELCPLLMLLLVVAQIAGLVTLSWWLVAALLVALAALTLLSLYNHGVFVLDQEQLLLPLVSGPTEDNGAQTVRPQH